MSGGYLVSVWWCLVVSGDCLVNVWWCLLAFGECLVVSGGVWFVHGGVWCMSGEFLVVSDGVCWCLVGI
jgi:hypothetical protein